MTVFPGHRLSLAFLLALSGCRASQESSKQDVPPHDPGPPDRVSWRTEEASTPPRVVVTVRNDSVEPLWAEIQQAYLNLYEPLETGVRKLQVSARSSETLVYTFPSEAWSSKRRDIRMAYHLKSDRFPSKVDAPDLGEMSLGFSRSMGKRRGVNLTAQHSPRTLEVRLDAVDYGGRQLLKAPQVLSIPPGGALRIPVLPDKLAAPVKIFYSARLFPNKTWLRFPPMDLSWN